MPPNPSDYLHSHAVQTPSPPKPNHKFLAIILKALVMTFVTSLFFLFLGVAAMLLLLFLSAGAVHRASRLRTRRHHRRRRPAHSRAALRRLAQFRFSAADSADADGAAEGDCVVCLDAFRDGQWCRKLAACGHVFHRRCLDTWLVKTPACPICRTRVRLDAGDGFSSAEDWEDEAKWWWGFDRNNGFEGLVGM